MVAAIKPTLLSEARGAVKLVVQAGDLVKEGETVAINTSSEISKMLGQEKAALSNKETNFKRQQIQAKKSELEISRKYI
ncbi:MAG: HlyD family secretion protein [Candidatus Azotimanducaceae bacterium]